MDVALALFANGLIVGGMLALMAVGFAIVYTATSYFHVAQAAVFSVAGYMMIVGHRLGLPLLIAVMIGVGAGTIFGLGVDRGLYRPLARRGTSRLMMLIASLATFIVADNVLAIIFTMDAQFVRVPELRETVIAAGRVRVTWLQALGLVVALLGIIALGIYLARTRQGRAIRAAAGNPTLARALGFPLGRLQTVVFAASSLLASMVGVYFALDAGAVPYRGLSVFLIAAIAVIAGGIGSIAGAAIAAFAIGVIQSMTLLFVSAHWATAIVFTLFIIWIVIKPEGLAAATTRKS
jgi:branched-chain amino acid transport system permease protein